MTDNKKRHFCPRKCAKNYKIELNNCKNVQK